MLKNVILPLEFYANATIAMTAKLTALEMQVYHNVAFKSSMTVVNTELKCSVVTVNE